MTYAILQKRLEPIDFTTVATILVQSGGLVQADATRLARQARGILMENLSEAEARQIGQALVEQGLAVFGVRQTDLPELSHPEPLHNADCRSEGFVTQDQFGHQTRHAWSEIAVIACGRWRETQEKLERVSTSSGAADVAMVALVGVPGLALGTSTTIRHRTVESRPLVVDLFLREPPGHYRIDSQHFNYDYLGDRREPGSAANFRLLVNDLLTHATQSRVNDAARAAAAGDLSVVNYAQRQMFENECRWHLYQARRSQAAPRG
jgi:hypothetical protein